MKRSGYFSTSASHSARGVPCSSSRYGVSMLQDKSINRLGYASSMRVSVGSKNFSCV
ncbi:hypothetical protein D3C78_1684440 [compost metagenome]